MKKKNKFAHSRTLKENNLETELRNISLKYDNNGRLFRKTS